MDLVLVYGIEPYAIEAAPGKDNKIMIGNDRFEHFAHVSEDGHYYLRPDRIMSLFIIDDTFEYLDGIDNEAYQFEREQDQHVKDSLQKV